MISLAKHKGFQYGVECQVHSRLLHVSIQRLDAQFGPGQMWKKTLTIGTPSASATYFVTSSGGTSLLTIVCS